MSPEWRFPPGSNNAYKITDYKAANLETISDKTNFDKATNQLEKELCDHYKEIVDYNANVNLCRCKFIEHGIAFCVFGFIGLIISTIALIIVIGE